MSELLSEKLKNALEYSDIEIPSYITSNLSKELREYQILALKHFYLQRKNPKTNHLMFNMATGSGKTLVMAALMLESFKNGYENFIFFVNSKAILEKTKVNFCDKFSSKYLFSNTIIMDEKRIEIRAIENLDDSTNGAINIYFTTIQGLFSLFKNERENSITLGDLVGKKLVFLADEAHHLNSETKDAKLKNDEKEIKESWESVVDKAFKSCNENLLLEFSATIPNDIAVQEKYKDKIIYKYDLAEFCKDGYAKRIFLLKYENDDIEYRFLGACLMSLFRQLVLHKKGEFIKPVILFKSENITKSNENNAKFVQFIENLKGEFISEFYKNLHNESLFNKNELLAKSYQFFKNEFGEYVESKLVELVQVNFEKEFILNANDNAQLEKNQILLNCLENKDNSVRVIFSVDKLNEGWDVLNLFDIVRLKNASASKAVTTKEAQLIGRGARYCPFLIGNFEKEMEFRRKFDKNTDDDLSVLERLSYHARNERKFINDLNEAIIENGLLLDDDRKKVALKPQKRVKERIQNDKIYYAKNEKLRKTGLLKEKDKINVKFDIQKLQVPLFAYGVRESEVRFEKENENPNDKFVIPKSLKEIEEKYYLKAMNALGIGFDSIKSKMGYKSKKEFIAYFLGNINVYFDKKQEFNVRTKLEITKYVLQHYKNASNKMTEQYEVGDFKVGEFSLNERVIFTEKKDIQKSPFEWLLHDKLLTDSELESEFLGFIESQKGKLDRIFEKWFVVRNEGFSEFKIYKEIGSEVKGFEPDFILFAKRKGESGFFGIECFIEAKGEHLAVGVDKWKEDFLKEIKGKKIENGKNKLEIQSLPFFLRINDENFRVAFEDFCNQNINGALF